MQIFFPVSHALHSPRLYLADGTMRRVPESPARAEKIIQALRSSRHEVISIPLPPGFESKAETAIPELRRVHAPAYLDYLRTIHARWHAEFPDCDLLPDTFPPPASPTIKAQPVRTDRRNMTGRTPSALSGQFCFDTAAPITAGTWPALVNSVLAAIAAADAVLHAPAAYALCRPPGHHAGPDYCGGFCYLNNAALAAQRLLNRGMKKIAILDVDYHHGNGTQDIFYCRRDVLFLSLHADPDTQYPYFWGRTDQTGAGPGKGFTANFPLPRHCAAKKWFAALDAAFARIRHYRPDALIVSLGIDIHRTDPVGDFRLSDPDFTILGKKIARLALPTLIIQEGGYHIPALAPAILNTLTAFK